MVVKADGLALGKGVIIAETDAGGGRAIDEVMVEGRFGEAGRQVVVEEFLVGEECSIHALVGGGKYLLFPGAQDHKRALDGDEGPNTGGMGTFSPPAKLLTPELEERVRREVMEPFLSGLKAEGMDYRGMLFPGLMVTAEGPKVLEFNCRFGDPETQVLLTRLESDLLELLEATIDGHLDEVTPAWRPQSAVCVVMASGGYPGEIVKGERIVMKGSMPKGVVIFHAGTALVEGNLVTAGGRVLGVTALGEDLQAARDLAYEAVEQIDFKGRHFRRDIGAKGL